MAATRGDRREDWRNRQGWSSWERALKEDPLKVALWAASSRHDPSRILPDLRASNRDVELTERSHRQIDGLREFAERAKKVVSKRAPAHMIERAVPCGGSN
jgi:hypothetical protein